MFTNYQLDAIVSEINAIQREGREILLRHLDKGTHHIDLSDRYDIPPGTMGNLMRSCIHSPISFDNAVAVIAGENKADLQNLAKLQ